MDIGKLPTHKQIKEEMQYKARLGTVSWKTTEEL